MTKPSRWFRLPDACSEDDEILRYRKALDNHSDVNLVVCSGRRSYKTELAKRALVKFAMKNPNVTVVVGSGTNPQVKNIYWRDLKALIPKELLLKKPSEVALQIELINGSRIVLSGLIDQSSRLEGQMFDLFVCDETQLIPNIEEIYQSTFQPGLNAANGRAIFIGRPKNFGAFIKWFNKGKDDKEEQWDSFQWHSDVILTKKQIELAKSTLSKEAFDREYAANFSNSTSLSYSAYSELNTMLPQELVDLPIDPRLPIVLSFDFNYSESPMTTLIGQFRDMKYNGMWVNILYIQETLSNVFTNTASQMVHLKSALNRYTDKNWDEYSYMVHGDYTGNYRQSSSNYSDYDIIEQGLAGCRGYTEYLTPCKSIRNAVAAVNNRLQTADGRIYTYINAPLCEPLVDDMTNLTWDEKSTDFTKIGVAYDHAGKAMNYLVEYHFPTEEDMTIVG